MLMLRALGTIIAALLGLAFGSFLNVCASRWPEGESIVAPRSHCRTCGRTLEWYENVPLASWLVLRGRCRGCGARIGWRYPLVELAVGVAWAIAAWQAVPAIVAAVSVPGLTAPVLFNAVLLCVEKMILSWLLIALAVLDAEHLWLPDRLTLGGALLGLPFVFLHFAIPWASLRWPSGMATNRAHVYEAVVHWVIGVLLAPAIILFIRWAYRAVRKQEGMGLGDAKLMLLLAVWLGLSHTLLAFVLGVAFGTAFALVLLLFPAARREAGTEWQLAKLPFGTFLCIGGLVSAFWGTSIIHAYLRASGF